jgi:hypothetical protein
MCGLSCDRKRHLAVDFAIWRNEGAWFWCLVNPGGGSGMIGASASEVEAVRDARLSIEKKAVVF